MSAVRAVASLGSSSQASPMRTASSASVAAAAPASTSTGSKSRAQVTIMRALTPGP